MKLTQKVRIVRRVLRSFRQEQNAVEEDLRAFYAPSECYRDAYRALERQQAVQLSTVLERLDLPVGLVKLVLERCMQREAPHTGMRLGSDWITLAPPTYDDYSFLLELERPVVRAQQRAQALRDEFASR